jgi:SAM-dependent methyltransferase
MKRAQRALGNRRRRESLYSTAAYWDGRIRSDDDAVRLAESMWPNEELDRLYHREQTQLLQDWIGDLDGRRVLDVGCGTGRISRELAARGAEVLGIDFAGTAIEAARRYSPAENPTYRTQSIFELDEIERFDVAVSWGTLTVACGDGEELGAALERLRRALVPGGVGAILEPVHSGFLHRVLNMSLDDFLVRLESAGFAVRQVREMHFWPARLLLSWAFWLPTATRVGHRFGELMLKLPGLRHLGDYKAVLVVRG